MQCEKFEQRWNETLDQRQLPEEDALLMAHAGECRRCAELLGLADALWIGLDTRSTPEPSADFAQRVLVEWRRPRGIVSRPTAIAALLALAAALAVVVGLRWLNPGDSPPAGLEPAGAPNFASDGSPDPFARPGQEFAVAPLAPMLDALPGLNDEYLAMLRQTGTAVALLPGKVRRVTLSDEPGVVADRIRPVAQPMTAALDALRRALPGSASDAPESPGISDEAKSSSYPVSPAMLSDSRQWS